MISSAVNAYVAPPFLKYPRMTSSLWWACESLTTSEITTAREGGVCAWQRPAPPMIRRPAAILRTQLPDMCIFINQQPTGPVSVIALDAARQITIQGRVKNVKPAAPPSALALPLNCLFSRRNSVRLATCRAVLIGGGHIVRPTTKAIEWLWSHSEKALLDFLVGIYCPTHPALKTSAAELLGKFPPSTTEGQIIISW